MGTEISFFSDFGKRHPIKIKPGDSWGGFDPEGNRVVVTCTPDGSSTIIERSNVWEWKPRNLVDRLLGRRSPVCGDTERLVLEGGQSVSLSGGAVLSMESLTISHRILTG